MIISPHTGLPKPSKVVPVNPVPSFIALWQKIALTVDPEKYQAELGPKYCELQHKCQLHFGTFH